MIKLRKVDKSTKHLKGRIVLSADKKITFPSSEEIFIRRLTERLLASAKDFKCSGIKLTHFDLEIK